MAYDGSLKFDTKIDQKGFTSGVASIKKIALQAIAAVGISLSAGAIAQALIQISEQGIELASNLNEVQNVIDVTFEDGAARVNAFAKSAVTSYGLSELAAKKYTGTMGAMLKSMGLSSDAVENMSTSMTGLAGDFASFFNITTEEAFDKIRAGITGETEPLRQLGINMSVANLDAYALAQGIDKTYASMTQAEQATLRYNYLMSVSSDAQGDFARTSDSYANSQRLASLAVDELKTAIGNGLLPAATKMQGVIRDLALEAATAFDERGLSGIADMIADKFPVASAAVTGLVASLTALLIIKTLIPLVVAFQAAQVQLTLGLMGTTAAALLQANELTVLQIIVGVFTGKVKLAAAAQALFAAATTTVAGVVGLATIAIGALVATIVLVQKGFEKAHPEIYETRDAIEALNKSVEESRTAYEDTLESLEKQRASSESLISTLTELSAGYSGSTSEQAKMQAICDELNSAYNGLNLTFDANTGKLSQNADAIRDVIEAQIEAARTTAMMDRYTQLLTDIANAEYDLRVAQKEQVGTSLGVFAAFAPWNAAAEESSDNVKQMEDTLTSLRGEEEQFLSIMEDMGITLPTVTEETDDLTESLEEEADATKRVTIAGIDVTQTLENVGMSADDAAARLDTFTSAATNMFEKISTKSKYTVKQMIANLTANAQTIEQWGENIAILGEKLPESLLQPLIDQGPEQMAGVVKTLADASDEELAALVSAFEDGGSAAIAAWYASLGAGIDTPPPKGTISERDTTQYASRKAMVEAVLGKPAEAIASSDALDKAASGAVESAKNAMTKSAQSENFGEVADDITSDITAEFDANSDLFYDAGESLAISVGEGFKGHESALLALARQMAIDMSAAFYDNIRLPTSSGAQYDIFGHKLDSSKPPVVTIYGDTGGATGNGPLGSVARIVPLSAASNLITTLPSGTGQTGGTTVLAPITVQGVVESDAQLSRRITKDFTEVIVYGRP